MHLSANNILFTDTNLRFCVIPAFKRKQYMTQTPIIITEEMQFNKKIIIFCNLQQKIITIFVEFSKFTFGQNGGKIVVYRGLLLRETSPARVSAGACRL